MTRRPSQGAHDRGVASFFSDPTADPTAIRVCRGTSCELAGAAELRAGLERGAACRDVFCLGHCDTSPALLFRDGSLATGAAALSGTPEAPAATSVRCIAPEAIVTERLGRGGFDDLEDARTAGAYRAIERVLDDSSTDVIDLLERAGERGRGGAGFATGVKWRACARAPGPTRYIVANGDEGDPGSFVDRVILEDDPHAVIEGMLLCARSVGAKQGFAFVRSEYPRAIARLESALAQARRAGLLGRSILGSDLDFDVALVPGLGSYVCGEETALLNAIEGRRGEVRLRPPYPATEGLYGAPTVVNNVETLVNVPAIVNRGAEAYARLGTETCSGTKVLSLNRGFARPGLVEVEFGTPLAEVVETAGGGAGGGPLAAVLLGGPMGSIVFADDWDVPVCYDAMAERGIQLGHGGLVALPEGFDPRGLLLHLLRFLSFESCGKCVPCRLGSTSALGLVERSGGASARDEFAELLEVIEQGSLCAFGQLAPGPMRTLLDRFGGRIFGGGGAP